MIKQKNLKQGKGLATGIWVALFSLLAFTTVDVDTRVYLIVVTLSWLLLRYEFSYKKTYNNVLYCK